MFAESFVNFGGTFPQNANKTLKFSQPYLTELKRRSEIGGLPDIEIDPITGNTFIMEVQIIMVFYIKIITYQESII